MVTSSTALRHLVRHRANSKEGRNMYQIIDTHTGAVVAIAKSAKTARTMRDRRDLAYGACRYSVRAAT